MIEVVAGRRKYERKIIGDFLIIKIIYKKGMYINMKERI